jgi:hypothetical protein
MATAKPKVTRGAKRPRTYSGDGGQSGAQAGGPEVRGRKVDGRANGAHGDAAKIGTLPKR